MAILPMWEMIEEAYERIQVDARAGYDYRTARRSLTLLLSEWTSRGLNLWTIETVEYPLLAGANTVAIPATINDIMDVAIRETSVTPPFDTGLDRRSLTDWLNIPFKTMTGRPTQYAVERNVANALVRIWPVPVADMTLTMNQIKIIQGVTTPSGQVAIPERFQPALIAGLAYYLSQKRNPARLAELRALYDEAYNLAADEDRDRSSLMIAPEIGIN